MVLVRSRHGTPRGARRREDEWTVKVTMANAKKYLRRSAVATVRRLGLESEVKEYLARSTSKAAQAVGVPASEEQNVASPASSKPSPSKPSPAAREPSPALSSKVTVVHPWSRSSPEDVPALRERLLGSRSAVGAILTSGLSRGADGGGNVSVEGARMGATRLLAVENCLGTIEVLGQLLAEVTTPYVVVSPIEGELFTKAVGPLVETLEGTGFGLASGGILHTAKTGDRRDPELAASHASNWVAELRQNDELFADRGLTNKVFRTELLREAVSFCTNHGVEHPVAVALTASVRTGPVAIAATPVIAVPFPTESAAIRRWRATPGALHDALATVEAGERILNALGEGTLLEQWRAHSLGTLLAAYYPLVPRVDEGYWSTLSEGVRRVAGSVSEETLARISVHNRVLVHLIAEGRRDDAEAVSYFRSDYGSGCRIDVRDGAARFAPGYLRDLSAPVPEELLVCAAEELGLTAGIFDYRAVGDTRLRLTGYAFIPGIDVSRGEHKTWLELCNLRSGETVSVPVEPVDLPAIDRMRGGWELSYAGAGFTATVDTAEFPGLTDQQNGTAVWEIRLRRTSKGITRSAGFTWRDRTGAAGHLDVLPLSEDGWRLVPTFSADEGLRLSLDTPRHVAREARLTGRTLELLVRSPADSLAIKIVARCAASGQTANATLVELDVDSRTGRYELELPPVPKSAKVKGEWKWELAVRSPAGGSMALAWAGSDADLEASVAPGLALTTRLSGFGYLSLVERRWRMRVTACRVTDDGRYFEIEGDSDQQASQAPRLVLSNARRAIDAAESKLVLSSSDGPNRFSARFDLRDAQWGHEDLALEAGAYSVRFIPPSADVTKSHWLLTSRTLADGLPVRLDGHRSVLELSRTEKNGALKVFVKPRFTEIEATKVGQRALQDQYFTGPEVDLARPAEDRAVLVECYGGRRATDTVLEVAEHIAREHPEVPVYWGVVDESVPVPAFAQPVVIDSEEWYIRLSSSRLLVNNNNFPHYFRKRAGQYYLQTWHGTPLKRLVFDVDRTNFSLSYWALMAREATYWDLLVAQNPYAEEVLAKAFHYEGEVFAEGYPRNDSLLAEEAPRIREQVRAQLGIRDHQKVALYAPTWRDNAKSSSRQYAMVTYLEFDKVKKALGKDWVILLRGHHNVASGRAKADLGVIDVTDYPQVNDLYLAADALIGDYSSVMFDFHVQDKPSVFLAPDIDEYADSIRGFYFDFKNEAPGPLVSTTDEVVQVLRHLHIPNPKHEAQRRAFREKFAPQDDGHATDRLVQRLPIRELLGVSVAYDGRTTSADGEG